MANWIRFVAYVPKIINECCDRIREVVILTGNSQVQPLQEIENGLEAQQTSVQKQAHLSFSFQF